MNPLVGIVMGSDSDIPVMEEAFAALREYGVPFEARVLSAHRTPHEAAAWAAGAAARGIRVIICGAGWAAHLAGAVAARTTLPVIGVPIDSSPLSGLDALYATVQMPPGVPVATMAVGKGGARNAGLFAVQVLALSDAPLAERLLAAKHGMALSVLRKDEALQRKLAPEPGA